MKNPVFCTRIRKAHYSHTQSTLLVDELHITQRSNCYPVYSKKSSSTIKISVIDRILLELRNANKRKCKYESKKYQLEIELYLNSKW